MNPCFLSEADVSDEMHIRFYGNAHEVLVLGFSGIICCPACVSIASLLQKCYLTDGFSLHRQLAICPLVSGLALQQTQSKDLLATPFS